MRRSAGCGFPAERRTPVCPSSHLRSYATYTHPAATLCTLTRAPHASLLLHQQEYHLTNRHALSVNQAGIGSARPRNSFWKSHVRRTSGTRGESARDRSDEHDENTGSFRGEQLVSLLAPSPASLLSMCLLSDFGRRFCLVLVVVGRPLAPHHGAALRALPPPLLPVSRDICLLPLIAMQ